MLSDSLFEISAELESAIKNYSDPFFDYQPEILAELTEISKRLQEIQFDYDSGDL